jgi:threonine/homoserine/homoserine lactone efflux protein
MDAAKLLLFCATVLPLVLTPGPDIIYITTRGIAQGRRAAVVSTLGVCAGYSVHTLLAVLGLTAVLYASETLFNVVRYAGAAYLLYLGISCLRSKSPLGLDADRRRMSWKRMALTGMTTSILNPKGILLFFAYFPQFVTPSQGNPMRQLLIIGTLFTLMCAAVYGTYGFFSGAIGERLLSKPRIANTLKWFTGSVLIGLGLRMALPSRR